MQPIFSALLVEILPKKGLDTDPKPRRQRGGKTALEDDDADALMHKQGRTKRIKCSSDGYRVAWS